MLPIAICPPFCPYPLPSSSASLARLSLSLLAYQWVSAIEILVQSKRLHSSTGLAGRVKLQAATPLSLITLIPLTHVMSDRVNICSGKHSGQRKQSQAGLWPLPSNTLKLPRGHRKRGEQLGVFQHLLGALLTDPAVSSYWTGSCFYYYRRVSREFWHFQLPTCRSGCDLGSGLTA